MKEGIYLIIGFLLGVGIARMSFKTLMGVFFKLTFAETADIFNGWYNRVKLIENREQKDLSIKERNELLKSDITGFMQRTVSKNIIEDDIFKE